MTFDILAQRLRAGSKKTWFRVRPFALSVITEVIRLANAAISFMLATALLPNVRVTPELIAHIAVRTHHVSVRVTKSSEMTRNEKSNEFYSK